MPEARGDEAGPVYDAFIDALREPEAVYLKRTRELFADPDAHGGLRGRKGLFVPKPDKEERAKAIAAWGEVKSYATDVLSEYHDIALAGYDEEIRYRKRLTIKVPVSVREAAAALAKVGRVKRTHTGAIDEVVAEAISIPGLRDEIVAFSQAVGRRFGYSGAVGHSAERGLGPSQWLNEDQRATLSGGGFVATYPGRQPLQTCRSGSAPGARDRGRSHTGPRSRPRPVAVRRQTSSFSLKP